MSIDAEDPTNKPGRAWVIPVLMFLVSMWFWESTVIYPFKLLVVFLHELSHGISAVITGGSIISINVFADEGGLCTTRGGWMPLVYSAGYLGSLLWGSAFLLVAAKTRFDREAVAGLGGVILLCLVLYIRNTAGVLFALGVGLGLIALAKYAGEWLCDQFLRYIGLTSSLYVVKDIKSDLIDRSVAESDASQLGRLLFGLPGWVVGVVWLIIALAIVYWTLGTALGKEADEFPRPVESGKKDLPV